MSFTSATTIGDTRKLTKAAGLLVLPVSERAHSFGGLLRMGFGVHFR